MQLPTLPAITFSSGYMSTAWDPDAIEESARAALANVDYDTLVGTGLSGALVVPQLARALGKHALIVRKPNDGSHSWQPVEGTLGRRWLFVDDFIDSGATRTRVRETIKNVLKQRDESYEGWEGGGKFHTAYVGDFLYNAGRFKANHEGSDNREVLLEEAQVNDEMTTAELRGITAPDF